MINKKVEIVNTIVEKANLLHDVLKVLKAFLHGYEAFITELKGGKLDEN